MTITFHLPELWFGGADWRKAILLLLFPVLLAAGLREHSASDPALPEAESYRTPLPNTIFESSRWRMPQQEKRSWRVPPPPPVGWRTPQASQSQSQSSSSTRSFELFPRYRPGDPSDFDMFEHEEKPLIKIFEFGAK